jgi:hypothetical protein
MTAKDINGKIDGNLHAMRFNNFRYGDPDFDRSYPSGSLTYFEIPASWNRRMHRQLGVFLYDSMNYKLLGLNDLKHFLSTQKETPGPGEPTPVLTKLLIPHVVGREIFERLELMGITASLLFENPEGAATDVVNSYNYGRRVGRAWDVTYPSNPKSKTGKV